MRASNLHINVVGVQNVMGDVKYKSWGWWWLVAKRRQALYRLHYPRNVADMRRRSSTFSVSSHGNGLIVADGVQKQAEYMFLLVHGC